MREIPLTQGQVALVDDEDYAYLSQFKWYARWNARAYYASRQVPAQGSSRQRTLNLHNVVWERHFGEIPHGMTVDHHNVDSLDNRISNLRLATRSQQNRNQKVRKDSSTGFRGVTWYERYGQYAARIRVHGKLTFLGYFDDPVDAARAYNAAATEQHGEFARLNEIPS